MSRRRAAPPSVPCRGDAVEEARLRGERPEPDRMVGCPRCGRRYDATPPTGDAALLLAALEVAVMMATDRLARLAWSHVAAIAHDAADEVASTSDLEFGGKRCAIAFAAVARGLAALSFCPGGVVFLGQHWCAAHPEAVAPTAHRERVG